MMGLWDNQNSGYNPQGVQPLQYTRSLSQIASYVLPLVFNFFINGYSSWLGAGIETLATTYTVLSNIFCIGITQDIDLVRHDQTIFRTFYSTQGATFAQVGSYFNIRSVHVPSPDKIIILLFIRYYKYFFCSLPSQINLVRFRIRIDTVVLNIYSNTSPKDIVNGANLNESKIRLSLPTRVWSDIDKKSRFAA